MSRPRRIEPEQVRQMVEAGMSRAAIAEETGLTVAGVAYYIREYKLSTRERLDHKSAIPWEVTRDHANGSVGKYLRDLSRTSYGKKIRPEDRNTAIRWARELVKRELDIAYNREEPPNELSSVGGFYTKPADPEDWHLKKVLSKAEAGVTRRL